MGSLAIKQSSWIIKPPVGTAVNLAHPLAQQLTLFLPMWEGGHFKSGSIGLYDISGNNNHALANTQTETDTTWGTTPRGIGLTHGKTVNVNGFTFNSFTALNSTWSLEALINFRAIVNGSYNGIITAGNTLGWWFKGSNTNQCKCDFYSSGDHLGTTVLNTGTWYQVVVTSNGSNLMSYYINGTLDATFAIAPNFTPTGILCDNVASGTEQFDGTIEYLRVWKNRILQPTEIIQLYQKPYDMFMPITRRIRSGTAAGAANRTIGFAGFGTGGIRNSGGKTVGWVSNG